MPNGYSKVTWVEHVEVDDRAVHNIYRLLVTRDWRLGRTVVGHFGSTVRTPRKCYGHQHPRRRYRW
ncbi:Homeobox-leucine zipper protein ROC2 [Acorus calamus]|uniref:Homeobox-leucine zipper protein ROC2 n=1 Tax=Acorus calamus TaxID=4465 RepID=A0AAV9C225_ACOCL|nr:Homeobox-leucine zipper protein ROC2 [Acorus calamus]